MKSASIFGERALDRMHVMSVRENLKALLQKCVFFMMFVLDLINVDQS